MTNDECEKKYNFRRSYSLPHPRYKDTISFEGLEAEYVNRLESEISFLKEAYERLLGKQDWMTTQEMYRMRERLEEEKEKNK